MIVRSKILKLNPSVLILISFLLTIMTGTLLLELPIATHRGAIRWIDALFTATSAVCVTGLTAVDTGTTYTLFGQWIILALIQIGGLGLMTISVFLFRFLRRGLSFRHRMAMQDLFAHTPREDILILVRNVILFTVATEAIGAALLVFHFNREWPFLKSLYLAIFHSVSAFCNAGFALFPNNLMSYRDAFLPNLTICFLIVIGGIGFPVLYDLQSYIGNRKTKRVRLSVNTKVVLITTLILIVAGALLFAFLERDQLRAGALPHWFLVPLFQSITCRTAGFNTVDIGALGDATLTLMILLMFVGASPGSCGGGVKTTTIALLSAFTVSRIRKHRRVNIFKKSIPNETVTRSVSLVLVSGVLIGLILFLILVGSPKEIPGVTGSHGAFLAYLFETVSAFGTVGLSMNVTATLNTWAKFWIIVMMIIGRVGILTFAYIIVGTSASNGIEYSEENLMIG